MRRANLHSGKSRKKRVYSSKYALSSIVYCSKCGEIYRRMQWQAHGKKYIVWRCCTRVENGPGVCDAEAIREVELQSIVVKAINKALGKRDSMKATLAANIETVITDVGGVSIAEIDTRLEQLQNELLKVAGTKENYDEIADVIYSLREQKQKAMLDSAERQELKLRINEMSKFLDEQTEEIKDYDEQLTRRLIEKITVFDSHFTVEFKS